MFKIAFITILFHPFRYFAYHFEMLLGVRSRDLPSWNSIKQQQFTIRFSDLRGMGGWDHIVGKYKSWALCCMVRCVMQKERMIFRERIFREKTCAWRIPIFIYWFKEFNTSRQRQINLVSKAKAPLDRVTNPQHFCLYFPFSNAILVLLTKLHVNWHPVLCAC